MAFWAKNFGEANLSDPKRNFRFIVEFSNIQANSGSPALWYAKSVAKPSFTVASAEHKYLNHTFYYPGSVSWNDIALVLVDPVDPDVVATLADIMVHAGYAPPTTPNSLSTMSKSSAAGAMGTVTIKQIDASGKILEEWTLWNSFISDIKFGDSLEYGNDELTQLNVSLKYDWARLETYTGKSAGPNGANANTFFDTRNQS